MSNPTAPVTIRDHENSKMSRKSDPTKPIEPSADRTIADKDKSPKEPRTKRKRKKKKKKPKKKLNLKTCLLDPLSIIDTIKSATSLHLDLVERATQRLEDDDVQEYLKSSSYKKACNERINMIPISSIRVLPYKYRHMKSTVSPMAITQLNCINEAPPKRPKNRGRRGDTNRQRRALDKQARKSKAAHKQQLRMSTSRQAQDNRRLRS